MLNWIKKKFGKQEPEEPSLPPLPPYIPMPSFQTFSDFQKEFEEVLKRELEESDKAKEDIKKLHPVTQNILKDLDSANMISSFYSHQPKQVRLYEAGKVIEEHVQKAIFQKKIEDMINDKRN